MSMKYIRQAYGVPAKRGGRVKYIPYGIDYLLQEGVIVGSRGHCLRIRMDDTKRVGIYHPTFGIEYI